MRLITQSHSRSTLTWTMISNKCKKNLRDINWIAIMLRLILLPLQIITIFRVRVYQLSKHNLVLFKTIKSNRLLTCRTKQMMIISISIFVSKCKYNSHKSNNWELVFLSHFQHFSQLIKTQQLENSLIKILRRKAFLLSKTFKIWISIRTT